MAEPQGSVSVSFLDKVDQARQAGYNDGEILGFLKSGAVGSKIDQAREAGYNDTEILNYLSQPAPKPEASFARTAGLAARAAIQAAPSAILGLPALAMDAAESAINAPSVLYNMGAKALGSDSRLPVPYAPFRNTSNVAKLGENIADVAGTPVPATPNERILTNVGSSVLSAAGGAAAPKLIASTMAPSVATNVMSELAAGPIRQTLAAGTGSLASSVAAENGASPTQQFTAGLLGSFAPTAIEGLGQGAAAGSRYLLRGNEQGRQSLLNNLDVLNQVGITKPNVGLVADAGNGRSAQGFFANAPGAAGKVANSMNAATEQLGQTTQDLSKSLSPNVNSAIAGRAISEGIDNFVSNFKEKQSQLYGKVNEFVSPDTPIRLDNTISTLERLTGVTPDARETSKAIANPKLVALLDNIKTDIQNNGSSNNPFNGVAPNNVTSGVLPLKAVNGGDGTQGIRQLIGSQLGTSELLTDIPKAQLKQVYAALMQDLKQGVADTGNQQAVNALSRADNFTKAGHARIDDVLNPIVDKNVPEKVYNAMLDNKGDGATNINTIMKSLDEDQRKIVAANVIKKLGTARPGQQDAEGGAFSASTFLTELNKIDPNARRSMFSQLGVANDIDKIAKAAELLKEAGTTNANPSGTARNTAIYGMLSAISGGFAAGGLPGAATGATAAGGAMLGSTAFGSLLTEPRFVKWLAKQTDLPPSAMPGQLRALDASFRNAPPSTRQTVYDFINAVNSQQQ